MKPPKAKTRKHIDELGNEWRNAKIYWSRYDPQDVAMAFWKIREAQRSLNDAIDLLKNEIIEFKKGKR